MNSKGIAYVVTKDNMIAAFGAERWTAFIAKLAKKDKYFSTVIMSITPMPVEKLIVVFDEMCKEFFNDDKMQYVKFGKAGARAVLSPDGPYKSFMLTKDIKQFIESVLPKVWTMYFDSGVTTARLENNVAHIKSPEFKFNILISNTLLWVTFSRLLKCLERNLIRNESGVVHRAMKIFISHMN